jgi:hypothetical protein
MKSAPFLKYSYFSQNIYIIIIIILYYYHKFSSFISFHFTCKLK